MTSPMKIVDEIFKDFSPNLNLAFEITSFSIYF